MIHLMRMEMQQKGTAGRQQKRYASDESADAAEFFLPAAVATGVDAEVGDDVVNAGRHSQTLQASSPTNLY